MEWIALCLLPFAIIGVVVVVWYARAIYAFLNIGP